MTWGSPDSERVGSTGRLGHEGIVEEPEMTKERTHNKMKCWTRKILVPPAVKQDRDSLTNPADTHIPWLRKNLTDWDNLECPIQ